MESARITKSFVMPFSDILKLLRIPFSVFLLPVFLFPLVSPEQIHWKSFAVLFVLLHFMIYPASNAYNSYMDQDTESIGGLEKPPKAGVELYYVSNLLDITAVFIAFLFSWKLAVLLVVYSVVSRLYSWKKTRLKKFPWISLAVVALVQGGYTYMVSSMYFTDSIEISWIMNERHLWGFAATTCMVAAIYPLTQIYQHTQDVSGGDITASYVVGIKGTFWLSGLFFGGTIAALSGYFYSLGRLEFLGLFLAFLLPSIFYFFRWARRCYQNYREANFKNTMRMNQISSLFIITAFVVIWMMM